MKIIYSEKCLEYHDVHIESPERVEKARDILKGEGYAFINPSLASLEDILLAHEEIYVERIKSGDFYDPDTPAYENIYEYARLSAGGAILAAKERSFSLMRPPGHHAGRDGKALRASSLGFCFFNNIAIAVKKLRLPTLILDIDGHHGNGTQEIFQREPRVTFVSLHRYPHYPGTGSESEGNCLNFPLSSQTGDELYLKTLNNALAQVDLKNIEVVGISAGFDAHQGDLASLDLTTKCYLEIGRRISKLGKPVFGILEGGYIGANIGADIHGLIRGLEEK